MLKKPKVRRMLELNNTEDEFNDQPVIGRSVSSINVPPPPPRRQTLTKLASITKVPVFKKKNDAHLNKSNIRLVL